MAKRFAATRMLSVRQVMLTCSFTESDQTRVPLPHTSSRALTCLIHFLYKCNPDTCPEFDSLTTETLLELVKLSDKYLLTDLNLSCCHKIIRHSATPQYLVQIYSSAIQSNYPVNCAGRCVVICSNSFQINVHVSDYFQVWSS